MLATVEASEVRSSIHLAVPHGAHVLTRREAVRYGQNAHGGSTREENWLTRMRVRSDSSAAGRARQGSWAPWQPKVAGSAMQMITSTYKSPSGRLLISTHRMTTVGSTGPLENLSGSPLDPEGHQRAGSSGSPLQSLSLVSGRAHVACGSYLHKGRRHFARTATQVASWRWPWPDVSPEGALV